MNALFFTQSSTLKVYYDVLQSLRQKTSFEKIGFYMSDSGYYNKFLVDHPDFESRNYSLLKEWVVTRQAQKHPFDIERLKEYQKELGVLNFWDALVCDRRIVNGPKFSFRQDYVSQFSHEDMLNILLENLIRIEKLFDEVQPDFTAGFICTTIGEYLCYLFSRSRNIPYLNLRATRISNYMMCGQSVYEPSEFVATSYKDYQNNSVCEEWHHKAEKYLTFSREKHAKYEGVFLTTQKPPQVGSPLKILRRVSSSLTRRALEIIRMEIEYRRGLKYDRPLPGLIKPLFYLNFLNPLLVWRINKFLANQYVQAAELPETDYVFFPLAKEPENTLLVYSKPYLNQIEVVRNVASSLPVGKLLLVKDHPASVGTRSVKYYQKLLLIPNVRLVNPRVEPRELIKHTDLVVTIAGSVGFEALILKKAVIIFGQTPYEMLPASMIKKVIDLNQLSTTIANLVSNHQHNERALINYIAATMKESVSIEFYTKLLGRSDQFATAADSNRQEHVDRLAEYTLKMVKKAQSVLKPQKSPVQVVEKSDNNNGNGRKVHNGQNGRKRDTIKA